MILLQLLFTYTDLMQKFFQTVPLPPQVWLLAIGCGVIVTAMIEVEKWIVRHFLKQS